MKSKNRSTKRDYRPVSLDGIIGGFGRTPIRNPLKHSPVGSHDRLKVEVWRTTKNKQGRKTKRKVDSFIAVGNILVTDGLDRLAELIATGGEASNLWVNAMAIGTDSTAEVSTNTALGASTQRVLLSQASMNVSDQGSRTTRWVATFASDGNASAIHEVGLEFTTTAATTLIARKTLGTDSINRGASDEIRVSYDVIMTTASVA